VIVLDQQLEILIILQLMDAEDYRGVETAVCMLSVVPPGDSD